MQSETGITKHSVARTVGSGTRVTEDLRWGFKRTRQARLTAKSWCFRGGVQLCFCLLALSRTCEGREGQFVGIFRRLVRLALFFFYWLFRGTCIALHFFLFYPLLPRSLLVNLFNLYDAARKSICGDQATAPSGVPSGTGVYFCQQRYLFN
jgi:hypothetical protein